MCLLSRLARGEPRNGAPDLFIRMQHAYSVALLHQIGTEVRIRAACHILFPCLLFPNEFPRLLAKREIIANAYDLPKKFAEKILRPYISAICKSNDFPKHRGLFAAGNVGRGIWDKGKTKPARLFCGRASSYIARAGFNIARLGFYRSAALMSATSVATSSSVVSNEVTNLISFMFSSQ